MENKQLFEKQGNGYNPFFPLVRLEDIIETISDKSIQWIFNNYNHIYVEYSESREITRNKVPQLLRRSGLWISYNNGKDNITEHYIGENTNVNNYVDWTSDDNWKKFDELTIQDKSITYQHLSDALRQLVAGGNTITNFPDEEDITTSGGVLSFKDRDYDPNTFSGLGRVILRKNLKVADGQFKNILTQDMINKENTIYEIRYDFDLNGQEITIPEGCVLDFQGGSLSNGNLVGKISNEYAKPEWFYNKSGNWHDAIIQAHKVCGAVMLSGRKYPTTNISFTEDCQIIGIAGLSELTNLDKEGDFISVFSQNISIENILLTGNGITNNNLNGLVIRGIQKAEASKRQFTHIRIKYFGGIGYYQFKNPEEPASYRAIGFGTDIKVNDCRYGMLLTEDDIVYNNLLVGGTEGYGIRINSAHCTFNSLYAYATGQSEDGFGIEIVSKNNGRNAFGHVINGLRLQECFRGGLLLQNTYGCNIFGDIDNCYMKPEYQKDICGLYLYNSSHNNINIVTTLLEIRDRDINILIDGDKSYFNYICVNLRLNKQNEITDPSGGGTININPGLKLIKNIDLITNNIIINGVNYKNSIELDFNKIKYEFLNYSDILFENNNIIIPPINSTSNNRLYFLKTATFTIPKDNVFYNNTTISAYFIINSSIETKFNTYLNIVANNSKNNKSLDIKIPFVLKKGINYCNIHTSNAQLKELFDEENSNIYTYIGIYSIPNRISFEEIKLTIEKAEFSYGKYYNDKINNILNSTIRHTSYGVNYPVESLDEILHKKRQLFCTNDYVAYTTETGESKVIDGRNLNHRLKGDITNRPLNDVPTGFQYFDTTLNKPIWWTGTKWVDATGADV